MEKDLAGELSRNRAAITKLAASQDARQLMALLENMGGVQSAAQSAVKGDASALMAMVEGLVNSEEGARIVGRIREQAQQAGLKDV